MGRLLIKIKSDILYKMEEKNCQNCKQRYAIDTEDFSFYKKINVPPPTFCPDCRSQRRLAWRNDTALYNSECGLCKKPVVTIYSKESGMAIYCNKCWWGDKWDPENYGLDYDFSRPFFEQFNELVRKIPHMALNNDNGIASLNCEYTQDFAFSKNVYMSFIGWKVENVMYSYYVAAGKDMVDCMNIKSKNEFLYECIRCAESYKLKYSQNSKACVDSAFMIDCLNCTDCFMCSGLQNKKYHYKNKEYSREEYFKILEKYKLDSFSGVGKAQKEFDEFALKHPRRYVYNFRAINCTGDILSDSKNSKYCFNAKRAENCRWVQNADTPKDSYDLTIGGELSECYEGITPDLSNRNLFGIFSWKDQDIEYTNHCHSSQYLFGCVGIRSKKYCILNKQYTKEEYEILVKKIKKHMDKMPYVDRLGNVYKYGEFYPVELSMFGYNETVAPEHFPLTKDQAIKKGYSWQDNLQRTTGKETIKQNDIPDSINDIKEDILEEILACIECGRNYKIIPNELIFYKKMNIPIPRKCFYCRHSDRVARRNPYKLWHRTCMCEKNDHLHEEAKCEVEFETSYAPDRKELVYCEKCFHKEFF